MNSRSAARGILFGTTKCYVSIRYVQNTVRAKRCEEPQKGPNESSGHPVILLRASGHPGVFATGHPVILSSIRSSQCFRNRSSRQPLRSIRSSWSLRNRSSECARTKLAMLRRALPLYLIFRVSRSTIQAWYLFSTNSTLFSRRITEQVLLTPCIFEVFANEFVVPFVCRETRSYTVSRGELNPVPFIPFRYPLCATKLFSKHFIHWINSRF